jgi:YesN/AraC family two-component response regulator
VTTRVLLVDDEHMVREGFRLILETQPDIRVVGKPRTAHRPLTRPSV